MRREIFVLQSRVGGSGLAMQSVSFVHTPPASDCWRDWLAWASPNQWAAWKFVVVDTLFALYVLTALWL